jgi:hypothetical protein
VRIDTGSAIRSSNPSNLPHDVVGTFDPTSAADASNSTGTIAENMTDNNRIHNNNNNNATVQTSEAIPIDSGFIEPSESCSIGLTR